MRAIIATIVIAFIISIIVYGIVGTNSRVEEIKIRVPKEVVSRNWKILRYEGFQYGSFANHGGIVWYHVCNIDNENIQYRVGVSLWGNELQWYYGSPEKLTRIEVKSNDKD